MNKLPHLLLCCLLPVMVVAADADLRANRYTSRTPGEARAWQENLRTEFFEILKLSDLLKKKDSIPFAPQPISVDDREGFIREELSIQSTPTRRIKVVMTRPKGGGDSPLPGVVCIHGHGGNRYTPYDESTLYKQFGTALAGSGFVTISCDVGQHEVYEEGRTLMGERLWDVMRCVDFLVSLEQVDKNRIGCAGLSLGGEMAMWLAAMDPRVKATVSSGFLTLMDQMEQGHCMCWKFPGLRERVDFPDIYSMIAPRPLQCQNGLNEASTMFTVPLAKKALEQVKPAYADFGEEGNLELEVHDGGHEIHLPPLVAFLKRHLGEVGERGGIRR